jgi:dihydrolipoamide dehydrogenase
LSESFDLVVVGAGTGGYVAAIRAAQLGLRTAVVERQPSLGGTCLNWGCIPTKTLLEHAHALKIARQADEWGITFGAGAATPAIDLVQVHARQSKIVSGMTRGVEYLFKKNQITWVKGTARFVAPGHLEVSGIDAVSGAATVRALVGREVLIATGSAPRRVSGIVCDGTRIITSDEAIVLPRVPPTFAVIGSGAVGVEFASIFRSFGSEVTIIEVQPRLVPNEDAAISAELERMFRKRGISVKTGATVSSAVAAGDEVVLKLTRGESAEELRVDTLLVATGRRPVTDGLGLEAVGVDLDRGFVRVDAFYRTNVAGISAIGDVISIGERPHLQLAHVSSAEGVLVAERIAGQPVHPLNYDHVPSCTYADPEIGSVGLTEEQARAAGHEVRVATVPFSAIGRARIAGEGNGLVKIVGDAVHDQLLGVHIVGPRATELVAEATVALRLEATVEDLVRTVHAHPTLAEAIGEAAHALHGGTINL